MTDMNLSTLDSLLSGGGASAKFDAPGTTYTGEIVSINVRQTRDFSTNEPETWDDGRPKEQIVVEIATSEQDSPDDDGHRNVYIKGWGDQLRAFRQAVRDLGRNPATGDLFTATYTGDGEVKKRGFNAPKLFKYEVKASAAGLAGLVGQPEQPAPERQTAPTTQSGGNDPVSKATQLIQLGLSDEQIAQAAGLDINVVTALRNQ